MQKIRTDRVLYNIFKNPKKYNLNKDVDKEINDRLHDPNRPNWVVIQITGETGEFKSSVGLAMLKNKIDPTFHAGRVTMEYSVFQEMIKNSEPKQAFMLDEQVFQRGLGSVRIRENMLNIVETLRKRQNSMVLITPREKFISDDACTFTLEPIGFDKETKEVRCLVKKGNYLGFYIVPLLWEDVLWSEYELVKDDFLEVTKSQEYKKFDYDKVAIEILKKMPSEYREKAKKKRISLFVEKNSPNITKEEKDLLVEQIIIMIQTGEA